MARSDFKAEEESMEVSTVKIKEKMYVLFRSKLEDWLFILIDEFEVVCAEKIMLSDVFFSLKYDVRILERNKIEFEYFNEVFKSENFKLDGIVLVFIIEIYEKGIIYF